MPPQQLSKGAPMISPLIRRISIAAAGIALLLSCSPLRAADPATPSLIANQRLETIAAALQGVLDRMGDDLADAAARLGKVRLDSADAHRVLSDLCGKHLSAVDCSTIDPAGVMIAVEPEQYRKVESADISSQEQVRRLHRTKKPVLSKAFKAVEGFYGIDYEWPILTKKGELLGSVSMLLKPQSFISRIVAPQLDAATVDVWVMQVDGQLLYTRYPKEVGDNLLVTPAFDTGPTFNHLVKQISLTPEGEGDFRAPPSGGLDSTRQRCAWKTIESAGTPWRVVLFGTREED